MKCIRLCAVKYLYNARVFLTEVKNPANNDSFWKADKHDAEDHITMETLGNGLVTVRQYTNPRPARSSASAPA